MQEFISKPEHGSSTWNDIISVGNFANADHAPDNTDRYFTVNSGDEMRLAYHCPNAVADYMTVILARMNYSSSRNHHPSIARNILWKFWLTCGNRAC